MAEDFRLLDALRESLPEKYRYTETEDGELVIKNAKTGSATGVSVAMDETGEATVFVVMKHSHEFAPQDKIGDKEAERLRMAAAEKFFTERLKEAGKGKYESLGPGIARDIYFGDDKKRPAGQIREHTFKAVFETPDAAVEEAMRVLNSLRLSWRTVDMAS